MAFLIALIKSRTDEHSRVARGERPLNSAPHAPIRLELWPIRDQDFDPSQESAVQRLANFIAHRCVPCRPVLCVALPRNARFVTRDLRRSLRGMERNWSGLEHDRDGSDALVPLAAVRASLMQSRQIHGRPFPSCPVRTRARWQFRARRRGAIDSIVII